MQILTMATWNEMRTAFVEGRGTVASLCQKYGANLSTAYARAQREGWTRLRRERGQAQLAALVPSLAPPPVAPPTPEGEIEKKVQRLELQLAKLDELLEGERDAAKLDKLTASKGRLLDAWCRFKNVPQAGSRRHRAEKSADGRRAWQPRSPLGPVGGPLPAVWPVEDMQAGQGI